MLSNLKSHGIPLFSQPTRSAGAEGSAGPYSVEDPRVGKGRVSKDELLMIHTPKPFWSRIGPELCNEILLHTYNSEKSPEATSNRSYFSILPKCESPCLTLTGYENKLSSVLHSVPQCLT